MLFLSSDRSCNEVIDVEGKNLLVDISCINTCCLYFLYLLLKNVGEPEQALLIADHHFPSHHSTNIKTIY
jgi:hypothetical protein